MPLGIDPTVDYAFKRLFGDPAHTDVLIHLLNAVLAPSDPIVAVELLNPFNEKEFEEDKISVLDVKARDARGGLFNVEMQGTVHASLARRLLYYNALLYVGQLSSGQDYRELCPAITICFLKEKLFGQSPAPHHTFKMSDFANGVDLVDAMQIHTIELPKYNYQGIAIAAAPPLTQWAFFLDRAQDFEPAELRRLLPGEAFSTATEVIEMIAQSPAERELYEARRKAEMDISAIVGDARAEGLQEGERLGLEKGERLGLEKGERLGLEKGKQLGLEEGRLRGQEEAEWRAVVAEIRFLHETLRESAPSPDELAALDLDTLRTRREELRAKVQAVVGRQ